MARLVQPGKNGGWIGGSLSWGKLDSYGYFGDYPATQVRLLRELLALYRTRVSQPYYYYSHGNERSIELSAFESSRLWPLLDEAGRAGLQLVYGHKLGAVERYREARLCLDVTQAEAGGELAIAPVIRVDGPDAEGAVPVRFIGTEGHGVVYLDRAEAQRSADPGSWRFRPGPARPAGSRAAAGDGAGRPAAHGARRRAHPVPRPVLPAAAADGHGDLLGRFVHPAGDLGPDPGAARVVWRRPRRPGRLGVGLPGRRLAAARGAASGTRRRRVPGR